MRKRSQTIQADTYEEYVEMSIAHAPDLSQKNYKDDYKFLESPYCEPPEFFKGSKGTSRQNLSLSEEDLSVTYFYFEDSAPVHLDNQNDAHDDITSFSTKGSSRNLSGTSGSLDNDFFSPCLSPTLSLDLKTKCSKVFKAMIIGLTGTGRHSLLNHVFPDKKPDQGKKIRNPFDLVIKNQEKEDVSNTFKFWLRDPSDEKIDPLINVYYKSINCYIFIYKTDNPRSFECLEKAVAKIKKEVPSGKFRGLLIGNGDPSKRKVSFEDGLNFKNKHSLSEFIEVQPSSQNLNEILLDFLNKKD